MKPNHEHRKRLALTSLFAFVACIVLTAQSVKPNQVSDGGVYREQFESLRKQVTDALNKESAAEPRNRPAKQDLLALTKLIHRLGESSMEDSLHSTDNRPYLLISQGCIALDFVVSSLDAYGDTGDRSFLSLARSGDDLVKTVEKAL